MNKRLTALFGVLALSASLGISASEQAETTSAADRLQGKGITAESKQQMLDRMNNITPEEKERLNERFSAVQAASKAQADKASEDDEDANPTCKVVLCMFGKLKGASQSECKSAEKEYFDIIVKKKGKIRWSQTAKERLNFLNSCPSPENDNINKKFGKLLG